MRTIPYILFFFFTALSCPAQELLSDYRGMVYVRENSIGLQGDNLMLDLQIDLSGLSVGRYESLAIAPMLREGRDSLRLQPIVVNGTNKQKVYERTLAFRGKAVADDGAYLVVKKSTDLASRDYLSEDGSFRVLDEGGGTCVGRRTEKL